MRDGRLQGFRLQIRYTWITLVHPAPPRELGPVPVAVAPIFSFVQRLAVSVRVPLVGGNSMPRSRCLTSVLRTREICRILVLFGIGNILSL